MCPARPQASAPPLLLLLLLLLLAPSTSPLRLFLDPGQAECVEAEVMEANLRPGVALPLAQPLTGRLAVVATPRLPPAASDAAATDGWGARRPASPPRSPLLRLQVHGPDKTLYDNLLPISVYNAADVTFSAPALGRHAACFSRATEPLALEVTLFAFDEAVDPIDPAAAASAPALARADDVAVASRTVGRLRSDMRRLVLEQETLGRRQRRHAATLASSDVRAAAWAAAECATLGLLSLLQVWLFRRAFALY